MIGHALSLTHHWKKKWDWQDRLNQSRFSFWGWKVTSRIIVMRTSKKGYRVPMDLGNVCVVDLVGFLWVLFCSWCFHPLPCRFLGVGGGLFPIYIWECLGGMRPWQVTLRPLSLLCTMIRSHSYKPDFHAFRWAVLYSQSFHSPGKSDSSFANLRFFINKGLFVSLPGTPYISFITPLPLCTTEGKHHYLTWSQRQRSNMKWVQSCSLHVTWCSLGKLP